MKGLFYLTTAFSLGLMAGCQSEKESEQNEQEQTAEVPENIAFSYPETRFGDTLTPYHDTLISEPFYWMEEESAEEVKTWVNAQREVTENYLSQIPFRSKIKERLTEIWTYEKRSAPFEEGDFYYYYHNNGTQNQSVLYQTKNIHEEGEVFIDPNAFSEDGTAALSTLSFTKDGKYCVYGVSKAGSDWKEFYVMNTETKEKLDDKLEWIKFSGVSFYKNGFFYGRYDKPEGDVYTAKNESQKVYFHEIGTSQEEDILVFSDPKNPERSFSISANEDETYLMLSFVESTTGNQLYFTEDNGLLTFPLSLDQFSPILTDFEADGYISEVIGDKLYFFTNKNAPKYRLVEIDAKNPAPANWKDVLPEGTNVLSSVSFVNNQIIANYLEMVQSKMYIYNLDGTLDREIELPGIGMAGGGGDLDDDYMYYSFVNYTQPSSIYRYDFNTHTSELYFKPDIDFASNDYETKQVLYHSKDGTKIPMFITHKKGIELNGNNPCFLYGYGGFNISNTPGFRIDRTIFLENGGIYCVANLRGGGEFGEEWHKQGTLDQKQNVFDDFIAACEYLIEKGYTSSDKLAIHGRSNGGLLAGAVLTQRPDLMKVAVPKVGVLDMLKFHKFTIGKYWVTDYGCSDNAYDFSYQIKYSPVHNVKEGVEYPATFIVTGDHDDRVVPSHSYKFAAMMQHYGAKKNPYLIRIDSAAGHGAGKPIEKQIEEFTDTWTFVFYHLGMRM